MSITVYEPLVKRLRNEIRRGKVGPGMMLGTEIEFAKKEGISRDSVRLAVESLIEEGLVERRAGKGVFVRKPAAALIIEVIVPSLLGMWTEIAQGAQAVGRQRGFKTQIFSADSDFTADLDAVRRLPLTDVDGAIVGSLHQQAMSEAVIELHQKGFPIVVVDQQLQDVNVPSVVFDNYAAGWLAAEKLLARGHRRIGFVGYAHLDGIRRRLDERLDGLRDAVNDAGGSFDRHLIVEVTAESLTGRGHDRDVQQAIAELFARRGRPTAVLFQNDQLAIRGMQTIRRLGLRVPADISVAGVGCEWFEPTLSTVDLPAVEMGRAAMEMLLKRLAEPQGAIEHRLLPLTWADRGSIAAPRA